MLFDLDPPAGVGPVKLGMSREEAKSALEVFGEPEPFSRVAGAPPGWVVKRAATVFVYCDVEGKVNAVEFATPGFGMVAEDEVQYRGISLFRTMASDVLAAIRALGEVVMDTDGGHSFNAPNLYLGLWREGGPTGADGMPLYFESALVALPGYQRPKFRSR